MTQNDSYLENLVSLVRHTFISVVDYHTDTQEIEFLISDAKSKELKRIKSTYTDTMRYTRKHLLEYENTDIFDIILDTETLDMMSEKGQMEKSFVFRSRLLPKDQVRWIKAHLMIIEMKENGYHILGSFEDITEFKEKEVRQKRINGYRMKALKNAFEELYIIDLEKNRFSAFNINDINELRHPAGSFCEQDIQKVIQLHVHPDDREYVRTHVAGKYLQKQFLCGKKEVNLEYRLRADDQHPYCWMYATIMQMEDDEKTSAFMLIKDITEEKQASELRVQYRMLKDQMNLQIHHYEYVKEKENELRAFRHDLKNHLLVLESLHDAGKHKEFYDYINSMRGYLLADKHFIDTGNAIMDALLNEKFAYANQLGIELEHHIRIIPNLSLSVMDSCILLGNSLDNAIEACMRMEDNEHRHIRFQLVYLHNTLVMKVTNTIGKKVLAEGITFETTKENRELHGLGIRNMKNIADAHDGLFNLEVRDQHVILQITLYI